MSRTYDPSPVPRAPYANPFKEGGVLARQFNLILSAHYKKHNDMRRGAGNALASAFWRGYDGIRPSTIPRCSLAWACYRAGQYQRRIDEVAK